MPKLIRLLRGGPKTVAEVSEALDIPKESVYEVVDAARAESYNVNFDPENQIFSLVREAEFGRITALPPVTRKSVPFMIISGLNLGLRAQQGTLLRTCYEIAKKEGVYFVIILGNLIAGKPRRGQWGEFFLTPFEEQVEYAGRILPRISGMKQYFVSGWRELSWLTEGKNPGMALTELRSDIRYIGDIRETFELKGGVIVPTIALKSDAATYTLSYTLRGLSENLMEVVSYTESERKNPKLVIVGGLGTAMLQPARLPLKIDRPNNFHTLAVPDLCAMTPSQMARKKRGGSPVLGCQIVTILYDENNQFKDIQIKMIDLTAYQKFNDYLEDVAMLPRLTKAEKTILELLIQRPRTLGELSRAIGRSSQHTEKITIGLTKKRVRKYGRLIQVYDIQKVPEEGKYRLVRDIKTKFSSLDLNDVFVGGSKFGYASDSHLGEKHERPELYRDSLTTMQGGRVDAGFFLGDWVDGEGAFSGHLRELNIIGADNQREHLLKNTPPNLNFPIYGISGSSHEDAFVDHVGHDIIATFAEIYNLRRHRDIIRYLGGSTGLTPPIKGLIHYLIHPKGGATIGLSYRAQIAIENYLELFGSMKVNIFAFGHLHVALSFIYKGVPVLLVPCLIDQTAYLKERNLVPWLGMWVITYQTDRIGNITSIEPKYTAYEPKIA